MRQRNKQIKGSESEMYGDRNRKRQEHGGDNNKTNKNRTNEKTHKRENREIEKNGAKIENDSVAQRKHNKHRKRKRKRQEIRMYICIYM